MATTSTLEEGRIPVKEPHPEHPGVEIFKYEVRFGSSAGRISKRMNVKDVVIDIYAKELPPDNRVIARVNGSDAVIVFPTAPDPHEGFRGAELESMTLTQDVLVEYLDEETGEVLTTLRTDHLELSDAEFYAPGRAVIEQEGLYFAGDELRYDKASRSFSFQRNVEVRGTSFRLPGADDGADPQPDSPAPAVMKKITCRGPFVYMPTPEAEPASGEEDPGEETTDPSADPTDDLDLSQAIGGGLLTFSDRVVASQGETRLVCERLEITLDHVDETPTDETPADQTPTDDVAESDDDEAALDVTRMLAFGAPGSPATLIDAQGKLVADRISLDKTGGGQVIKLIGEPRIEDARLGSDENASSISARCAHEIELVPKTREEVATLLGLDPADPAILPAPAEYMVLQLRDDARLEVDDPDPNKSLELTAADIDLLFERAEPPAEAVPEEGGDLATDDPATDAAGEAPAPTFSLMQLVARGDAVGTFPAGEFRGDRIVTSPKGDAFELVISPNPSVNMTSVDDDGRRATHRAARRRRQPGLHPADARPRTRSRSCSTA